MSGGPLPDQIPKSLHVADRSRSVCSRQNMSAGASVYGHLAKVGSGWGGGEVAWEDSREWIWREIKHIVTENSQIWARFSRVDLEGDETHFDGE